MELIVDNATKSIKGRKVLDRISVRLSEGIYGLTGRNASGKTMLLRALSGLIKLDEGEVRLDGKVIRKDIPVLPSLGIIIENAGMYDSRTGYDNLRILADYKKKIGDEEIVRALTRVGLDPYDKRKYHSYSLGMKQKLAIAQAIMEEPDILLLDEPMNALDEQSVLQVRNVLLEEKDRGTLIIIASHIREDIDTLADRILVMDEGRLIKNELAGGSAS
jgi:ABC-2 type transport system ATP-binding protein